MGPVLGILLSVSFAAGEQAEPPSLRPGALRTLRLMPVQHEGRWSPLETVARDVVEQVTGTVYWRGRDPVLNLLDWTFRPEVYRSQPLIRVRSAEVRRLIGLPLDRDRFSLAFLDGRRGFNQAVMQAMQRRRQGMKPDALDGKIDAVVGSMSALREVLSDQVIRPVPDPNDPRGRWLSISEADVRDEKQMKEVDRSWSEVRSAFIAGNSETLETASQSLMEALGRLKAAYRPDPRLIALEYRYNTLNPFRWAWVLAAVSAGVALIAMVSRRRWAIALIWPAAAATFAVTTYGIAVRWQLAGRIPAANMYESMIFMGWGLSLAVMVCLVIVRDRLVIFIASLLAAISLMLADVLPLDSGIRPIAPVLLDTAWMAIHVPVIMVSYSMLLIAMGFALAILGISAAAPHRTDLIVVADHLHYRFIQVGAVLLTVGIITGSMWGSASWGRYWGWDPKEVWSLIALLGYLGILHARAVGWLRSFGTALCSTVMFWLVVMTYVGVNYVLGIGLHSYAFGKGAVVWWLMVIGSAQLALTAVVVGIYLARRPRLATNGSRASGPR